MEEDCASPDHKRRKQFTRSEVIAKLKERNHKITEVCQEICTELLPTDKTEEEFEESVELVEKLEKATKVLTNKVFKLSQDFKAQKFRRCPEKLEEKFISCSQHSVFQSHLTHFPLN